MQHGNSSKNIQAHTERSAIRIRRKAKQRDIYQMTFAAVQYTEIDGPSPVRRLPQPQAESRFLSVEIDSTYSRRSYYRSILH